MRTPMVAGNWKMNMTVEGARSLVYAMSAKLREIAGVEKVLCPPFTALLAVQALLEGSDIGLGAQNVYWEEKGAFTGEISAGMLKELCRYVIIGHSERRTLFGETDQTANRRVRAAAAADLTPIYCVGETLQEYEAQRTAEVVQRQIKQGLADLDKSFAPRLVVAYEPVWAIGTGKASTAENANRVIRDDIRATLAQMFGTDASASIRVLYGGSVTAGNAGEYFSTQEIDGALVGGASLKADDFVAITKAAAA
ncbi:MAG TPA: triose-phosphate isomerase [Anaerolineales bacterium]|nr:triose-phosphate isomerase [Anaerolineales bacterium]